MSYIDSHIKNILGIDFDVYLENHKGDFILIRGFLLFYNPIKCNNGITMWNESMFFSENSLMDYPYTIVEYDYVYSKLKPRVN